NPEIGSGGIRIHWHEEMEIVRVTRGTMRITRNDEEFLLGVGETGIFMPGDIHAGAPAKGPAVDFECVVFNPDIMGSNLYDSWREKYLGPLKAGELAVPQFVGRESSRDREICGHLDEIMRVDLSREFAYELETKGRLCLILANLLSRAIPISTADRRRRETVGRFRAAISLINEKSAGSLSIGELAQACGLSKFYFCRAFRRIFGSSPTEYINIVRIAKSMDRLESGDDKILSIALDTGFNDVAYFDRVFRKHTGVTPAAYRKKIRKSNIVQ
ncbi:MAG: AraC family transcriptional regulator, partial [Rectinemataceae bacterium]|nr:AraC family transcriptional regulator [Rectinemataceae bacterium]